MRYFILIFIVLITQTAYSQTYNLTITITNIKTISGEIKIGVYNTKYNFPHKKQEYRAFTFKVKAFAEIFTVKDLPKGEYAVAVFHDKNSDGICNTNFIGIPEEGYGFSKNFKPFLSEPSFKDCKIDLTNNMQIMIKLIL